SALMSLIASSVLFSFHRFTFISIFFWLFPLISIIVLMFGLLKLKDTIFKLLGRTQLEIDRKNFKVKWSFLGLFYQIQGKTKHIERVELNTFVRPEEEWIAKWKEKTPETTTACALIEGVRTHRFGSGLTPLEKEWLLQEVATFLKKPLPPSHLPR
ncbi:MAG TPA: hypothetical protein VIQ31_25715, partial [Phormidium sp.]